MFTMSLISNNNDAIKYTIFNGDTGNRVNEITVNKRNFSYSLKNGQEFNNHFETAAYRAIVEAIKSNVYPQEYSNGWG